VEHQDQVETEGRLDPGQTGGDHELKRKNRKAHDGTIDTYLRRAQVIGDSIQGGKDHQRRRCQQRV
jgi:hypothetical protein